MTESFRHWLSHELHLLALLEVSAFFDRHGYNDLFDQEVRRLMQEFPGEQRLFAPALSIDWVGYIAKSLRNAGFQNHDIDPLTHEIVIKLLVSPGSLFRRWDRQPVDARFKVAVRNALLNLIEKRRSQRRFPVASIQQNVEPGQFAAHLTSRDGETIEKFRQLVSDRLGTFALAVFDVRMRGDDVKSLVGLDDFGKPTPYRIKNVVQAIKKLAEAFAVQQGDESFVRQVRRAMADENEVVLRRVAGNRATRRVTVD